MNFYSEFGEDRWITENLSLPEKGVYLDVGAAHPTAGSNTAFLRDRGWRGVAIDANAGYAPYWDGIAGAVFITAIASIKPLVSFEFKQVPGHSRVEQGTHFFGTSRLDNLMQGAGYRPGQAQVDFLSLDIEGHEFHALLSMMDNLPRVIISEYSTEGLEDDYRVRDLLLGKMSAYGLGARYRIVHQTKANFVFLRKERHEP